MTYTRPVISVRVAIRVGCSTVSSAVTVVGRRSLTAVAGRRCFLTVARRLTVGITGGFVGRTGVAVRIATILLISRSHAEVCVQRSEGRGARWLISVKGERAR